MLLLFLYQILTTFVSVSDSVDSLLTVFQVDSTLSGGRLQVLVSVRGYGDLEAALEDPDGGRYLMETANDRANVMRAVINEAKVSSEGRVLTLSVAKHKNSDRIPRAWCTLYR